MFVSFFKDQPNRFSGHVCMKLENLNFEPRSCLCVSVWVCGKKKQVSNWIRLAVLQAGKFHQPAAALNPHMKLLFKSFCFRSNWPLFRPEAALNLEP